MPAAVLPSFAAPLRATVRRAAVLAAWPCWGAMPACGGLAMAVGRSLFWQSPDTPSYRAAAAAADVLGQMRLPLYGWLLAAWTALGLDALGCAAMQLGGFGLGMAALMAALRRAGVAPAGVLGTGLALAGSNLVLVWGNAALPEMLAHAALLFAMAAALQLGTAAQGTPGLAAAAVLACSAAWLLKPAFLPFAASLPLLVLHRAGRGTRAAGLLVLLLAVPLALSAVRAARGDGFRPVSFGGFQMAGMAGLMLDDTLLALLPPAQRDLAGAVLDARSALVTGGTMAGLPVNSVGVRSFASAAMFYFDILARDHDVLLWDGIRPLQRPGEAWPAFDTRLGSLAVATVRAAPVRYAAWVAGAASRLVGQGLVLNPAMLAACLALLAAWLGRDRRAAPPRLAGGHVLLLVNLVFLFTTALPQVALTFPASRYIHGAAMLLPGLPAAWALLLWQHRRTGA